MRTLPVALVLVVATLNAQDPPPRVTPSNAAEYVGKTAMVCGMIVDVGCPSCGEANIMTVSGNVRGVHAPHWKERPPAPLAA